MKTGHTYINLRVFILLNVLLILLSPGCLKSGNELTHRTAGDPANDFTTYTIKKGEHYSGGTYRKVAVKELLFESIFDSSCIYKSKLAENSSDINKLYGFSDCNKHHHENSARVGWLWNGEAIELYAYCYSESKRSSALLGTTTIGEINTFFIAVSPTHYLFEFKGVKTKMTRHCSEPAVTGYMLYPYFGGNETAPHDMHIRIR